MKTILLSFSLLLVSESSTVPGMLPEVPPADLTKLSPGDFADDELDMPYFLAHLHTVANSVVSEGENRGFIDIPVWRAEKYNKTYNARIMENYLSLAYFYCLDRPWNPYRGHPALRARLEAVLEYWCNMQNHDGQFSEYGPQVWNLPATAFATKFMGKTLTLLQDGPPVDEELLKRVIEADRKAIYVVLTDDTLYRHGRSYSNQYTNVWSGALAYLKLYLDSEMAGLLRRRIQETVREFQSPVGYFYEKDGPDWSYNLGTHRTNLETARHFTSDEQFLEIFRAKEHLFYEWLSYNAVLEPDDSGFVLNRAVETRSKVTRVKRQPSSLFTRSVPPTQSTELAWPFSTTQEEQEQRRKEAKASLERDWPTVAPLSGFTPYDFLARDFHRWLPGRQQRQEATAKLPYLARERFIHQRTDSRHAISYTFIRRPSYYAAFNTGQIVTGQQRYGLGLLWNPEMGAAIQSQTGSRSAAWGTRAENAEQVYEAESFDADFAVDGQAIKPVPGTRDLPDGDLTVSYPLGDRGTKKITFSNDYISVSVNHPGNFEEYIPLLVGKNEAVQIGSGWVELRGNNRKLVITHDASVEPQCSETRLTTGSKAVHVLQLRCADALTYRLEFRK